jgi:hypothetical protein
MLSYFANSRTSSWKHRVIFQMQGWQGDAAAAAAEGSDGGE